MDACIFCRIAARDVAAHVIHEAPELLAFLDIHPIRPGHALIISKQHFAYFEDTPTDVAISILSLAQRLAHAMKRLYRVPQVGLLFAGSDIPHVHAHVVPMHVSTDITSRHYIAEERLTFRSTPRLPDHELAETATDLAAWLAKFG